MNDALPEGGRESREEEILALLGEIRADVAKLAAKITGPPPAEEPAPAEVSPQVRHQDYLALIERIRSTVDQWVPAGSTVAVVSKGDPDLLRFAGKLARHFPADAKGRYVGHHPADSAAAIADLDAARAAGAGYLVVPQTAAWWLDYYPEFRRHLEEQHVLVVKDEESASIFRLAAWREGSGGPGESKPALCQFAAQLESLAAGILPDGARVLVVSKGNDALCKCVPGGRHFPATADGHYAGHHPVDSQEAIRRLESEITLGAEYLIIPAPSFWWLEFYQEFSAWLSSRHRLVTRQLHVAIIYELASPAVES